MIINIVNTQGTRSCHFLVFGYFVAVEMNRCNGAGVRELCVLYSESEKLTSPNLIRDV